VDFLAEELVLVLELGNVGGNGSSVHGVWKVNVFTLEWTHLGVQNKYIVFYKC